MVDAPRPFPHLDLAAAELAAASDDLRIQAVQSRCWIPSGDTSRIIRKLEYCMTFPPCRNMPNILLVGESGNGKTTLIERLLAAHPKSNSLEAENASMPIVYCEAPPSPDLGGFYNVVLAALGHAPARGLVDARRHAVEQSLALVGTRLLIIDEIQHGLFASARMQRIFLSAIKSLSNHLEMSILAAGTREALSLFTVDPQIERRFEIEILPLWQCDRSFARLLLSFERLLPLREPSGLSERSMASRLHAMSKGTIGRLARTLAIAGTVAIQERVERITDDILKRIDPETITDPKRAAG